MYNFSLLMLNQILPTLTSNNGSVNKSDLNESDVLPAPLRNFIRNAAKVSQNNVAAKDPVTTSIEIEAQGRWASWFSQAESDPLMPKGISRKQRILGFLICFLCASLCFCLAILFVPIIATPFGLRKFVLLYMFGSTMFIASFSFLWGPLNHFRSLFQSERLGFTLSYLGSLFLGIYGVIVWKSALVASLALIFQILLVVRQIISSIPGGRAGLAGLMRGGVWTLKGISMGLPV